MKKKSLKLNALLYMLTVGMGVVFPLVTFPYASRVLSIDSLGRVNYTSSIISYFSLLASLGINTYAIREGAKYRDDINKFKSFASEIFTTNLITTLCSYFVLLLCLMFVPKLYDYRLLILVQSVSIILNTLGVNWINSIYEDYLFITIRTFIIQIVSLISLFIFVKKENDFYQYAIITVLANGLTSIFNLIYCRKYTSLKITKNCKLFSHLKTTIVFFANNLAITIYVNSDMTMLGWLKGDHATGLYSVPVKIYTIAKSLLTCVYTVAIPRLALAKKEEKTQEYRKLLTEVTAYIIILGLPIMTGIILQARNIILIISGEKYKESILTLQLLAVALLFSLGSGVLVNGMNVTLNLEKNSLKATVAAAISNIALNLIFIPLIGQNGAAVTTIIAEFMVIVVCFIYVRKEIKEYIEIRELVTQIWQSILGCLCIVALCIPINIYVRSSIMGIIISAIVCSMTYIFALRRLENRYIVSLLESLRVKNLGVMNHK